MILSQIPSKIPRTERRVLCGRRSRAPCGGVISQGRRSRRTPGASATGWAGSMSGGAFDGTKDRTNLVDVLRQADRGRLPDYRRLDTHVVMGEFVPHSSGVMPGYLRVLCPQGLGDMLRGFSHDLELPDDGVQNQAVG